jgi:hypothetical protein
MMTESNFEGSKYWMGIVMSRWALPLTFSKMGWVILQEVVMSQLNMVVILMAKL